jgi:hypothetical protein
MATYSFVIEGADELKRALSISGKDAGQLAAQVIWEEANTIFAKSQVLTPIDTGALRASGGVSAPQEFPQGVGVDIFYGGPAAPYALFVHEIQSNYHNPPTKAKYLEEPFMAALPQIQKNLARRIMNLIEKRGQ